jgi:hypothetical protein
MAPISKRTSEKLSEQEIDALVVQEASDEAAWEAPVRVKPSERATTMDEDRGGPLDEREAVQSISAISLPRGRGMTGAGKRLTGRRHEPGVDVQPPGFRGF